MGPFGGKGGGKGGKHKAHHLKGSRVWVSIGGKADPRPVETGISDGVNVQILKGLSLGDSVVTGQQAAFVAKEAKEEASSPFMPGPPGKNRKKFK